MGILYKTRVEWARGWLAVNHYMGCGHLCKYCYGRKMLEERFKKVKWSRPKLKKPLGDMLREASRVKDRVVWLSSATDPYQPLETVLKATRALIKALRGRNRIVILTKSDLVLRDIDLLEDARIGLSITSLKPNPLEPHAPFPKDRIDALKTLKELGFETFVSIEPWIPKISEPLDELIIEVCDYADWIILGRLNHFPGVKARYYRIRLPGLIDFLEAQGLKNRVLVKEELRRCLPLYDWEWALNNLVRWLEWSTPR